jgi:hypothetical protein
MLRTDCRNEAAQSVDLELGDIYGFLLRFGNNTFTQTQLSL